VGKVGLGGVGGVGGGRGRVGWGQRGKGKGWVRKSLSDLNLLQCWKRVCVCAIVRGVVVLCKKICLTNDLQLSLL
jgi:hypothetical protein